LLAIKDSDIEILTLLQAGNAVDKGLHAGGAFLAIVPKPIRLKTGQQIPATAFGPFGKERPTSGE